MAASNDFITCEDFLEFQESLKRLRSIDDKIVYALNTTIPTNSFRSQVNASTECKHLYEQLRSVHLQREVAIKKCIGEVSNKVKRIKDQRNVETTSDSNLMKTLRKEQTKLRLMQAEMNVEEVVKDRSLKIFYEKCRSSYKPPDLKL